jgi:hypothetical protein
MGLEEKFKGCGAAKVIGLSFDCNSQLFSCSFLQIVDHLKIMIATVLLLLIGHHID